MQRRSFNSNNNPTPSQIFSGRITNPSQQDQEEEVEDNSSLDDENYNGSSMPASQQLNLPPSTAPFTFGNHGRGGGGGGSRGRGRGGGGGGGGRGGRSYTQSVITQARRASSSASSEDDEDSSESSRPVTTVAGNQLRHSRPPTSTPNSTTTTTAAAVATTRQQPPRRQQQQQDNNTVSANDLGNTPSNLPNIDEPEETPPPPRIVCVDGRVRSKTGATWEPLQNIKALDDMSLVKSYMSNRMVQFGTLTGRKRSRSNYESDTPSLALPTTAREDENEDQVMNSSGEEGGSTTPGTDNQDHITGITEILFSEADVHNAVIRDPFNLVITGNVGMREVLPTDTPLDRTYNLLVSSNSGTPEPIFCKYIADVFNKEVLGPYNRGVLQNNTEFIQKAEMGVLSLDSSPKFITLEDGTKIRVQLDPSTGKIPQAMVKAILKEGLGLPWTGEQVEARRLCNLNPHLDMENMAKRYKTIAEMLCKDDVLFVNTDECYANGNTIRRFNEKNFRCMVKCDEMYQKTIAWNGLSVFANRTTAMNMGIRTFSGLTLDTDTQELVREVSQHLGHRNTASQSNTRKIISKQSLSHTGATSQIGETSNTGKKMSSITTNTSNAQKRRRLGLPASKESGYHGSTTITSNASSKGGTKAVRAMEQFM